MPAIAAAHGIPSRQVKHPDEINAAIEFAASTPGPVVLDFHVEKEESVYPMVPTGADLHNMIRRPHRSQDALVETNSKIVNK